MKILVTGARGFVGRNLVSQLHNIRDGKARNYGIAGEELAIYEYDMDSDPAELDVYCRQADFVFNLAGVNRPKDASEFMKGNFGFASTLLDTLKKHGNTCPVMISSCTQATLDNPYGESKRAGEQLLFEYSRETGAKVLVYRFPNVFGKWCRPNYNSAVATFCNNIAHDQPIRVNDPSVVMHLVYIDDVVDELIFALSGREHRNGDYCEVPVVHTITLGGIVELIRSFRQMPGTLSVPDLSDAFTKKLYSTYLSYLPEEPYFRPRAVLGEHLQAGRYERPALAPYQEREVCGGERARSDTAPQDRYGGGCQLRGKRREDGGRGDDSRLYAQHCQPFGNGRPSDFHVVQRVFRPDTSGHLF